MKTSLFKSIKNPRIYKPENKGNIYKVHNQTTLRYELRDISSKLLKYTKEEADEFKRKKKNIKITKPKKVIKNNNKIRSFKILEDIEKLIELRDGKIDGMRNIEKEKNRGV